MGSPLLLGRASCPWGLVEPVRHCGLPRNNHSGLGQTLASNTARVTNVEILRYVAERGLSVPRMGAHIMHHVFPAFLWGAETDFPDHWRQLS